MNRWDTGWTGAVLASDLVKLSWIVPLTVLHRRRHLYRWYVYLITCVVRLTVPTCYPRSTEARNRLFLGLPYLSFKG